MERVGERVTHEVLRLTGSKSELVKKPLPNDDPRMRKPDISKARALIGFEPKVELAEGLRLSYENFKERVSAGAG